MLLLLALLLPAAVVAPPAGTLPSKGGGACTTALGCGLNGVCAGGRCTCSPAWMGAHCGALHLLPAPRRAAYPLGGPNGTAVSSWGGGVVRAGGAYHLYVSELTRGCGLKSWLRNSAVRHAVAASPLGPFAPRELVAEPFAHNPKPLAAPGGAALIFHIGCGAGRPVPLHPGEAPLNCSNGTTPHQPPSTGSADRQPTSARGELGDCDGFNGNVLSAPGWGGPWRSQGALYPRRDGRFPFTMDNPAPLLDAGGRTRVLFRSWCTAPGCSYAAANLSLIGMAEAAAWNASYATPACPLFGLQAEDPHLYRDALGYHALLHRLGKDVGEAVGVHAYSADGERWEYSAEPAYTLRIAEAGGGWLLAARRERPFLLQSADGSPTHLYTGVVGHYQPMGGQKDHSYTHVQALNTEVQEGKAGTVGEGVQAAALKADADVVAVAARKVDDEGAAHAAPRAAVRCPVKPNSTVVTSSFCSTAAGCCLDGCCSASAWGCRARPPAARNLSRGCGDTLPDPVCCSPGAREPPSAALPNCLILGDSVSIGYAPAVEKLLRATCKVQHAPFDWGDGGAGSTALGLACLDNWLLTQAQAHVHWDVIQFNFGLHDFQPRAAEPFSPRCRGVYREQLGDIASRLAALGATTKLQFATTTPYMPLRTVGDMAVEEMNADARAIMARHNISIVELYDAVTAACGAVYTNCSICALSPCTYHYNGDGSRLQAEATAAAFRRQLGARPGARSHTRMSIEIDEGR